MMTRSGLKNVLLLALCGGAVSSHAQAALTQALRPSSTSAAPAAADPLGRNTPSDSVLGFLKAAQDGNYSIAAQYLQMPVNRRQVEGEQIARKLKLVLDKAGFNGTFGRYNQPEGTPQEGIPLGRQKLGTMISGDVEVDLDLVRVTDAN